MHLSTVTSRITENKNRNILEEWKRRAIVF